MTEEIIKPTNDRFSVLVKCYDVKSLKMDVIGTQKSNYVHCCAHTFWFGTCDDSLSESLVNM